MPNIPKGYDPEKARRYRNAGRRKNYAQTAKYGYRRWTPEHDRLVLEQLMTDRELSNIIEHSVEAIQHRRVRLKTGDAV